MTPPHRSPPQPEEWIEAFAAQCTEALWVAARQHAARRTVAVRRVNSAADVDYEHELVQDAIGDTARGRVRWDPAVRSLKEHVFAVIRSRTSHDYQHAIQFRRESLDAGDDDNAELVAEVEAALRDRVPSADPALAERVDELYPRVRALAASDPDVMAVLDAVVAGACDKADVMHHARIAASTYHAAMARLSRIAKRTAKKLSPRAPSSRGRLTQIAKLSPRAPSSRGRRKKGI